MSNLLVKDVPFQGASIKAAQDEKGQVWVGVRWVCEAIGLTPGQIQGERRRIQNDLVLYKGERNLVLPTAGGDQSVMCLLLDYLPLWLAKISITPRMKEEFPEVVEKLVIYQLKAKDVLAQAFIPQTKPTAIVPQRKEAITPVEKFFDHQNKILERQMKIMEDFCKKQEEFFDRFLEVIASKGNEVPAPTTVKVVPKEMVVFQSWKKQIYQLLGEIIKNNPKYHGYQKADILSQVYHYMNREYGIVWAQEEKDFRDHHEGKFRTIDVVEENPNYRSILEAILRDLLSGKTIDIPQSKDRVEDLVVPLALLEKDTSNAYMRTCRKVYGVMSSKYGVDWKEQIALYQSTHFNMGKYNSRKIRIVNSSTKLLKIFKKVTTELCTAIERGDSIG